MRRSTSPYGSGPFTRGAAAAAVFTLVASLSGCGDDENFSADEAAVFAAVAQWNQISIDASGLDHMPANQGPPHAFGTHLGPCRSIRAIAMVHLATFEALNAIERRRQSEVGLPAAPAGASRAAAVAQAAHDMVAALFQSQDYLCAAHLDASLATVPDGASKDAGRQVGSAAAAAVLAMRANDGAAAASIEPILGFGYFPGGGPGEWRKDPIANQPIAMGALWPTVAPFALTSADQFRCPPFPALDSPEYAAAYAEVKALGGDGITTPTTRTADQTEAGIYWAYDGTPSLCAPPRLYNQIARRIAEIRGTDAYETARLLVLVNVAMADAGLASWESKYFYKIWRPVTGIRESDPGTGPSGLGDGNAATVGDPTFTPLGAPGSNTMGPNFTPPFPAYPSGHATFGGALFQVLRRFYGTDDIAFTFVSDEYNGETLDNQGQVRPLLPRTFQRLSDAEEENGQSRIYLGIHWSFDKNAGITQGNEVADWVFDRLYPPLNN
jgi:hypothetical protein